MEHSSRPRDELLDDLTAQAAKVGWTAVPPHPWMDGSGGPGVEHPAATLYKGLREFEIWMSEGSGGTEVRLIVSAGASGYCSD